MQRAERVAFRIAQRGEIKLGSRAAIAAHARRVFDRRAAGRDAHLVLGIRLRRVFSCKANGAAVAVRDTPAIDG